MAETRGALSGWVLLVLVASSLVVLMAMGLRAGFGLFQVPIVDDLGWGREVFSLAMAVQNLCWGVFQPFAAAAADRWGAGPVVALGGVLYAVGIAMMTLTLDPVGFQLSAGMLVGMAQGGCALAVLLAVVGRVMPAERRSWGLGIVTAAGAAGMVLVVPVCLALLETFGWESALLLLAASAGSILFLSLAIWRGERRETARTPAAPSTGAAEGFRPCVNAAAQSRSYWLLTAGFFVCGFQVAFVAVHLPAYVVDLGLSAEAGAWSLMLIGLFNIGGSYVAGSLGDKFPKRWLLSWLYFLRAIAIAVFVTVPLTELSLALFSAVLGLLWLSTVPLTSALVGQMFGPRYMGTLFSVVFLSHQVGSFLGIWLGGVAFDTLGSYDAIWWGGVALGVFAALVHLPIDERPVKIQPAMAR